MKRFTAMFLTILVLLAFTACGLNQLNVDSGQVKANEDFSEDITFQLEPTTTATTIVTTTEPASFTAVTTTVVTTTQPAAINTTRTATSKIATTAKVTTPPVTTTRKATTTTRKSVTTTAKPKPTTTVPTTAFDVQYWVDFAKTYAVNLGFELSKGTMGTWDTPLSAGPTLKYTERDIKDCLNRYYKQGYTSVWVWAEKRPNSNKYDIYISRG